MTPLEMIPRPTDEQVARLRELVSQLRRKALPVGPLHGAWDTIFDIEAFLEGGRPILTMTAEEWIAFAERQPGISALPEPRWISLSRR